MKHLFLFICFFHTLIFAKECSPYFNPDKFYDTPELLTEFIEEHIQNHTLFPKQQDFQTKKFIKKENIYTLERSFVTQGEYEYPIKTGLWKYSVKNKGLDEINISRSELYRFKDEEIANSINDDFENFWMDFIEDGYQMQLTPEQTLFRYNDEYFTFSVYIYGVVGDATSLKGTVVNFWFKNYTNEVNEFITCNKENNGSR